MMALFFMSMAAMSLVAVPAHRPGARTGAAALGHAGHDGGLAAEAMQGRFPHARRAAGGLSHRQERLRHMLQLGALYAVGFLLVIGLSALVDGGQFALVYLGRPS